MRPHRPLDPNTPDGGQEDLFRARLEAIIDPSHWLVRLAGLIDWQRFEDSFGVLYDDSDGAPGLSTRLMVGLHLIKHMEGISDEAVCARYLETPYLQYFCGEGFFRHRLALDRSSMTNWRHRIGPERLEEILAESLAAAERGGALKPQHTERVTVDTTVQPKAVAHPSDTHLILRALTRLTSQAARHDIKLRQSYARTAPEQARKANAAFSRGHRRQGKRHVKWLRTRLGRVIRDIERKIDGHADLEAAFADPLARAEKIRVQGPGGKDRLYAFHAREVECIVRGKARARYEFGVKVSLATTNARSPGGSFILGARRLPGRPHDGHSLARQLEQTERLTGRRVERAYVDRGYRGHGLDPERVIVAHERGKQRSPTIKRERKRRNAIEPVIGHAKSDGHLGRNFLKGAQGDATNLLLAAAGHNLRCLARWLAAFLRVLLGGMLSRLIRHHQEHDPLPA